MKPVNYVPLIYLIALIIIPGCGPSDEQVKKVIKVGSEIAELQRQYYPAITELGKVAVQIEAIGKRQDQTAKAIANDVTKAHELIVEAFAAGQKLQYRFPAAPNLDVEKYILAEEARKALLKDALDKTNVAVSKSHEVIEAMNNDPNKRIGKK
ncbi:MAG: hypothetical protein V1799_08025 [bacterium]